MRFRYLLLIFLLLSLSTLRANAQLEVDLIANPLSGSPGDTITFQATLVDLGSDPIYLNGVDLSGVPAGLTVDENPLFNSFPASPGDYLRPGDSYSGDLFNVTIDANLTPGSYMGVFTILGGADAQAIDNLANVNFEVDVAQSSAVPEPFSPIWLAGAGIFGYGLSAFRARRLR